MNPLATTRLAAPALAFVLLLLPSTTRAAGSEVGTLVTGDPAVGDAIVPGTAGEFYVTSYSSQAARVDPDGTVTVLASDLSLTTGLALRSSTATLYVGNNGSGTIRTVPAAGGASTLFLGGVGSVGLALTADEDTLYVAHYNTSVLSRIALDGGTLQPFATQGLNGPTGIAFASDGHIYVSNFNNGRIKRVFADGTTELLVRPPDTTTIGYLAHHDGFLYATSFDGHQIWKVGLDGSTELYAGTGTPGHVDGPALQAQFDQPNGITTTVSGDTLNVWVSEFGNRSVRRIIEVAGATTVTTAEATPDGSRLGAPRPNPARGVSRLQLELPTRRPVEVVVHDVAGRRVRTLRSSRALPAGRHELVWDGADERGRPVAPGTYFVRAQAGGQVLVRPVVRLR